ncbi:MAG: Spy/CpxP family protein refolding chaperone [Gammaproteobacteria bacterium]|nr:Spy/CpxP family protein refolding chaperone [Gammaproteobacteria bacterium]
MSKKFLWMIVFVSSLIINPIVFADTSICREGLGKMVQSLNLDNTQKAKIMPILDQLKSNLKAAGAQMNGIEPQLSQEATSPNMSQDNVNSLVDKKAKLIGDMMKSKITAKNQIFSILNVQQKEKLQSMMKKSEEKMAEEYKNCDED